MKKNQFNSLVAKVDWRGKICFHQDNFQTVMITTKIKF